MTSCLVVDDSQVVRSVARRILRDLDIKVTEAENGQEALESCRSSLPDLVLLDWNMPVMDGMAFLRERRGACVISTTRRPPAASTAARAGISERSRSWCAAAPSMHACATCEQ